MTILMPILTLGGLLCGCGTFQPPARQGHDLLDNPGRSAGIRIPAGMGAIVGHVFAIPLSVLLYPTYFFDGAVVESCDVLVKSPVPEGDDYASPRKQGDIYIPLVLAPFEYGSGLGAAAFGQPFEWIAGMFRDPPGPPPGYVEETPELPPGVEGPHDSFAAHPPRKSR